MFSAKLICVEFYPRTSPITIAGDRTVRWAKSRHAAKQGSSLSKHAKRSLPNLCSEGYTTFTALLHDKFLRPTTQVFQFFPIVIGHPERSTGPLGEQLKEKGSWLGCRKGRLVAGRHGEGNSP